MPSISKRQNRANNTYSQRFKLSKINPSGYHLLLMLTVRKPKQTPQSREGGVGTTR